MGVQVGEGGEEREQHSLSHVGLCHVAAAAGEVPIEVACGDSRRLVGHKGCMHSWVSMRPHGWSLPDPVGQLNPGMLDREAGAASSRRTRAMEPHP